MPVMIEDLYPKKLEEMKHVHVDLGKSINIVMEHYKLNNTKIIKITKDKAI